MKMNNVSMKYEIIIWTIMAIGLKGACQRRKSDSIVARGEILSEEMAEEKMK